MVGTWNEDRLTYFSFGKIQFAQLLERTFQWGRAGYEKLLISPNGSGCDLWRRNFSYRGQRGRFSRKKNDLWFFVDFGWKTGGKIELSHIFDLFLNILSADSWSVKNLVRNVLTSFSSRSVFQKTKNFRKFPDIRKKSKKPEFAIFLVSRRRRKMHGCPRPNFLIQSISTFADKKTRKMACSKSSFFGIFWGVFEL